jgi:hypothetical protein
MLNFVDGPFSSEPRRRLGGMFNSPTPASAPTSPAVNAGVDPIPHSNVMLGGRFQMPGAPVGVRPGTPPAPTPPPRPVGGIGGPRPAPYSYSGPSMSLLSGNPAGPAPGGTPAPRPPAAGAGGDRGGLLNHIFPQPGGPLMGGGFGGGGEQPFMPRRFF